MDVGGVLRDARGRRGLSLDRLSQATKIGITILEAIEANQVDRVPEGIFLRGYLRAYAREVGLDPEATVRDYLQQFESASDVVTSGEDGEQEPPRDVQPPLSRAIGQGEAKPQATHGPWVLGSMVVVISLAGYYTSAWWRAPSHHAMASAAVSVENTRSSPPVAPSTVPPSAPVGANPGGPSEATGGVAPEGGVLRLEIQAQADCWLSATADGTRVAYHVMQAGDRQSIEVHDKAVLRVGDPAAFAFSINGVKGRSLGPAGTAVTVQITSENYHDFLSPPAASAPPQTPR